jgi:hypothetical protein
MFSSGGADRHKLTCSLLAFITVLRRPLRELSHLFDYFLIICNYFNVVLIWFGYGTFGESTPFFINRIIHFLFFLGH